MLNSCLKTGQNKMQTAGQVQNADADCRRQSHCVIDMTEIVQKGRRSKTMRAWTFT